MKYILKNFGILDVLPLVRKFTQTPLLSSSTMYAFGHIPLRSARTYLMEAPLALICLLLCYQNKNKTCSLIVHEQRGVKKWTKGIPLTPCRNVAIVYIVNILR